MKFKKLLGGGLLATVLALGVGAGLAVRNESKEVDAGTPVRFNVLISQGNSWLNLNARTFIKYNDSIGELEMLTDSNMPTFSVSDTTYYWYTIVADFSSGYNDVGLLRYNSSHTEQWNSIWQTIWRTDCDSMKDNVVEVVDNSGFSINKWGKYSKVTYYAGLTDYSDLTNANVSGTLANSWSVFTPAAPAVTPSGLNFVGWYTDPGCTNPYDLTSTPDGNDITLYAKYAANTYTVSKYAVYDGDSPVALDPEQVEEGSYTPSPASTVSGYHFEGWYWQSAQGYVDPVGTTTVTGDISIYAVYKSRGSYSQDKYIYYVTTVDYGESTPNSIYTFGGENEFGNYGGTLITSIPEVEEVHGVLDFQGNTAYGKSTLIYKIPYTSVFNDNHLIINYQGSYTNKTADMLLVNGSAYWWSNDADYHNDAAGAAIDFLVAAENIRNSADYKGLADSVCGISKDDAEDLLEMYDALDSDTQKTYVDCTTAYTYDPLKSADEQKASKTETTVKYSLIVAKLREIASGNGPSANTKGISLFGDIDNSTPIMLVVIISVVSLTAVGGYIFLKRRKEN